MKTHTAQAWQDADTHSTGIWWDVDTNSISVVGCGRTAQAWWDGDTHSISVAGSGHTAQAWWDVDALHKHGGMRTHGRVARGDTKGQHGDIQRGGIWTHSLSRTG